MLAALFVLLQLAMLPGMASAQGYGARIVSTTSWVEEWDPATERWVRVSEPAESAGASVPVTTITTHIVNGEVVSETVEAAPIPHEAARYASPFRAQPAERVLGQYGPFRVIDESRAVMIGSTDTGSPAQFDAMLRDFPELKVLELLEAPGTRNDIANLELGRLIRASGLTTHVPDGGSVRSGAVELFLAGEERSMAEGAQFAVHSWRDNYGREADDLTADAPEHRLYLDYYVEMGMSEDRARDFYAMTNSAPHDGALWLRASDMAPWIAPEVRARLLASSEGPIAVPVLEAEPVTLALAFIPTRRVAQLHAGAFAGL